MVNGVNRARGSLLLRESRRRTEAWTRPGNAASDRVLEKGGFQREGMLRQAARF